MSRLSSIFYIGLRNCLSVRFPRGERLPLLSGAPYAIFVRYLPDTGVTRSVHDLCQSTRSFKNVSHTRQPKSSADHSETQLLHRAAVLSVPTPHLILKRLLRASPNGNSPNVAYSQTNSGSTYYDHWQDTYCQFRMAR